MWTTLLKRWHFFWLKRAAVQRVAKELSHVPRFSIRIQQDYDVLHAPERDSTPGATTIVVVTYNA